MDETVDPGSRLFAAEVLLARADALAAERAGVRQAKDIECIHRMRVASRRLRAALGLFQDCLPAKKAAAWQRSIRRITRALGEARDLDVQIASVTAFLQANEDARAQPGLARLLLRLRQRRAGGQAGVARALDRLAADRTIEEMEVNLRTVIALARLQRVEPASPTLFARARQAITERLLALHGYERYVSQPDRNAELHAMRIAAKRLRYTLELFAPLFPGELKVPLKAAKTLQEQLGDIHDCDVWLELLPAFLEDERARALEYFGHTRGIRRFAAGIAALEEDRRTLRARRYNQFTTTWAEAQEAWEELGEQDATRG